MRTLTLFAWKPFLRYWWLFALIFSAVACGQKKSIDNGEYSSEFKEAQKNLDKYWERGEVKRGLNYLDSAFSKMSQRTVHDSFRRLSLHYVYYQKTIHKYDTALVYADSMVSIGKRSVSPEQYSLNFAEASFCRGDALFELQQFSDAYQAYYQGYLTGKNYVNLPAVSDYTYRMGMIMYKQGHYGLATTYFKDSYAQNIADKRPINKEFVGFYRRQELLDNIGLSYRHNNQNDSAMFYFNLALKEITGNAHLFPKRKQHVDMARGVVYGNMAEVYMKQKDPARAAALLKKSIDINLKPGYDNRDAQLSELKLGNLYLQQHQTDSLLSLLNNLQHQLDTVKNPDAEAGYHRLISTYYAQKDDLKQAYAHLQLYNVKKDSIIKAASLLLETDVTQQLSNYEKQHQIDALSNDNKLQTIYIYAVTLAAVLAAIIIFLVYRNWRRSKKDVLTVKVLNQQINEQNQVLEKALSELSVRSQEKDRILRTVAHDLRNPIGGIASLTALMAEDEYTEEQKELINLVRETSVNSLELINEILEATNLQSVKLNLEPVEINSLVSNAVELLRFRAAEKGQSILLETMETQQELMISREKIWRVLGNLISNAIKFSPSGETIQVKVSEDVNKVIIAVKDNGIGIPEKLQDQVFNMFTSAQRTGTAGEKSFGLGLSICRQIIEKHNGKIWFASSENGSTFFISLPLQRRDLQSNLLKEASVPVA